MIGVRINTFSIHKCLQCHILLLLSSDLSRLMAHSSQTRIVGKVDDQFLHARWWL